MKSKLYTLSQLSLLKTIYLNFKYLPWHQAIKFPIFCSRHLRFRKLSGKIVVKSKSTGAIRLGFHLVGIFDRSLRSIMELGRGSELTFEGNAFLGNGFKICNLGGAK